MSVGVSISGRAEADLTREYRWYLENADQQVADRFLRAFDMSVARLARTPTLGHKHKFRAPELRGIRSFPVSRPFAVHLIFYKVMGDSLSIDRVMHGARDLPRRLLAD